MNANAPVQPFSQGDFVVKLRIITAGLLFVSSSAAFASPATAKLAACCEAIACCIGLGCCG